MSAAPNNRRLACEFLIAAAVCGGAYYFVAESARGKIAAVRRDLETAQQHEAARAGIGSLTDGQVGELRRTTVERVEDMRTRSAPAKDEAAMFARISGLAATHTVRIEQLNPSQVQVSGVGAVAPMPGVQPGSPAAAAGLGAGDGPAAVPARDMRIGYTMSVTGTYSDLAEFVGSLADRLGYTVVKSVRLSQPDLRQKDMLRAAIETEHFALDLSAIKLSVPGAATKQPMPVAPSAAGAATEGE